MFELYRKYLKDYKKHVILGPIFKLLEAIFELMVPFVIKNMIDNCINVEDTVWEVTKDISKKEYLIQNGLILLAFAFIGLCSTLVCQFFASRASQGVGTKLRDDLYAHINTLSFRELDYLSTSSLITRMTSDINNFQQSVAMLIRLVVRAPFIVIGATIMSFIVSIKAGIIFAITGVLLFAVFFLIMLYTIPKNKITQKKLDRVTTITKENLSGNRVVRAFSKQKYEFDRFVDSSIELKDIQVRVGRINALLNPLTFILVSVASIIVLYLGGKDFTIGSITQGDMQALMNYFVQIQVAIVAVTGLVVLFTKAQASATRINEVFHLKSSILDGNLESVTMTDTLLEFNNVSFKYTENANPAISDVSFSILKGQTVGIIGGTGSGKTTLVSLMNRFYDVTSGEVLFFGRNIKEYKLSCVNKEISTVMQKAILFNGTIRENLLKGDPYGTKEDMEDALKNSQSYEFVSNMDKGIDTVLYQGGKNLSGGQKQRLSIARALMKKSDILILDDSSSALDFKTESLLRKSISKLDKTTIIISQRASSIMHADMILVLDNGKLVGKGRHNELVNSCPVYREICDSQDALKEAR